jgi:peroxiredoxin
MGSNGKRKRKRKRKKRGEKENILFGPSFTTTVCVMEVQSAQNKQAVLKILCSSIRCRTRLFLA